MGCGKVGFYGGKVKLAVHFTSTNEKTISYIYSIVALKTSPTIFAASMPPETVCSVLSFSTMPAHEYSMHEPS